MLHLDELPDDILVSIFCQCDIEGILAIRLTCAAFAAVAGTYICTIAPNAARNTYPDCNVLLRAPKEGYSLRWLRSRIPAQLASVLLDKDKMRKSLCQNSSAPYGIPSESDCDAAHNWRKRIVDGWRVVRSLYLISKSVYACVKSEHKRPAILKRASSGVRSSRMWQVMSCPYPGCTQHGMKHFFDGGDGSTDGDGKAARASYHEFKKKESKVLQARLALIEKLPDQDLINYIYLWRILQWTFRPYRQPATDSSDLSEDWRQTTDEMLSTNWSRMINDIAQGCSWLNWYILHIGPSPFIQQWSLNSSQTPPTPNLIRDMIWAAYSTRTSHQIEVEREYICKLEFEIRKRCLTSERKKSLMAELNRGRSIRTISFDCVPWGYDAHAMVRLRGQEFPWYRGRHWLWLDGDLYLRMTVANRWSHAPARWKADLRRREAREECVGTDEECWDKGPLAEVRYLVYLGTDSAVDVWPESVEDGPDLAL